MSRTQSQPPPPFAVGDVVLVQIGPTSTMPVEIVEDRGLIGHAQRRFYRVRTASPDLAEQVTYELAADAIRHKLGRRQVDTAAERLS